MRFSAPAQAHGPTTPNFTPTPEQERIVETFRTGVSLVIEALAGTGKTTTLALLAAQDQQRSGLYLAYNKAIVREAEGRFPAKVLASTAHALAYHAVGKDFSHRLPGRGKVSKRMYAREVASLLGVKPGQTSDTTLPPVQIVRLAEATVNNWCKTGDYEIEAAHLPDRAEVLGPVDEVAELVVPVARKIWADLSRPTGQLYFSHDHYLKLWQLRDPKLPHDYILFDEAQDANPVIASIVARQDHAQLVYVGDRNQQLYGWRGAVDAMSTFTGTRLALTKSFRFGPAIAEYANEWLDLLGSPHRVVGHDPVRSEVGPLDQPADAILCRTNGTALSHILRAQERGVPVAMAPGDQTAGRDILSFAYAALDLMAGRGTEHPDLAAFTTWSDLLRYVDEEESGADLRRLVNIIHRIGPAAVIDAIKRLVPKEQAALTVSTAHKAKGLEWDRVQVADDFIPPEPPEPVDTADLMLAYVTVTRARLKLDPGLLDPHLWAKAVTWQ